MAEPPQRLRFLLFGHSSLKKMFLLMPKHFMNTQCCQLGDFTKDKSSEVSDHQGNCES